MNDRIYRHAQMRVNYTTYDGRRDQDTVNPRTRADIVMLNPREDGHPYCYARVCGIFHANVRYSGPGRKHGKVFLIHFLWARWYERDLAAPGGFSTRRLHRLKLAGKSDPLAFGFLDPDLVMRGCHVIPAFYHEKIKDEDIIRTVLQRPRDGDDQSDWRYYYVNM